MPPVTASTGGVAFLVAADIVYTLVAAYCSSPQTTEINADKRAATLMKWVNLGTLAGVAYVGYAAAIDPPNRRQILIGGGSAIAIMYASYVHAKRAGLRNPGPSTEEDSGFNYR